LIQQKQLAQKQAAEAAAAAAQQAAQQNVPVAVPVIKKIKYKLTLIKKNLYTKLFILKRRRHKKP
jgi:uncharacterized protein GlcG (DUF336 family)